MEEEGGQGRRVNAYQLRGVAKQRSGQMIFQKHISLLMFDFQNVFVKYICLRFPKAYFSYFSKPTYCYIDISHCLSFASLFNPQQLVWPNCPAGKAQECGEFDHLLYQLQIIWNFILRPGAG